MKLRVLILMGGIFAFGPAAATERTFPAAHMKKVTVVGGRGDIHVRGTQPARATVQVTTLQDASVCEVVTRLDKGQLTVRAPPGCSVDLDIFVPMQVDMWVENQCGNVFVSGIRGALTLHLGHGNAVVGGNLTALHVQGDASAVSATGLLGDSDIQVAAGSIQLWYDKQARHGLILLHVGEGHVTIALPARQVKAQVRLAHGDLQHDIDLQDTASFTIDGSIERGSLFIRQTLP